MGIRVGVVCEGSHDFNVLKLFISRIVFELGETLDHIDCLQPEMSATFQVTDGGWTQVKAWCERQEGQWYRKYLDRPLFATSPSFDVLVIHLDGDVIEHCTHAPLKARSLQGQSVEEVVSALEDAVENHWLSLQEEHRNRIVTCIPVRHLEAWLASAIGPVVEAPESRDMKEIFRSGPASAFSGSWRQRYIKAANQACSKLPSIRQNCGSFLAFEVALKAAVEAN